MQKGAFANVFTRGALGNMAGRVWNLLADKSLTQTQLAKQLVLSSSSVSRALQRLRKHDLAHPVGKRKWKAEPATEEQLVAIAKVYGTEHKQERRREEHARERRLFVTKQMLRARRACSGLD